MSRIPQPPSRNTARSPSKSPATSTPSSSLRVGTSHAGPSSRRLSPSPAPPGGGGSRTLRPQVNTKPVRAAPKPPPSPQRSPVRRAAAKLKPFDDGGLDASFGEPQTPQLSIREQIALRRAEAKKATSKGDSGSVAGNGGGLDDLGLMEDALPPHAQPAEDVIDLGRWSVKETIERARSTGEYCEQMLLSCECR